MPYEHLLLATESQILTITLNRPEVMNALNPQTHHELQAAFDDFAADPSLRVCIITGAGPRAFCAGSDLKAIAASGPVQAYPKNGYAGLIQRFDLTKPIIAAVNGVALGGGFEIALACDLIIAADTAKFGLPEPKVGGMAIGGGVHRLARQIGPKQALGMILTGAAVTAEAGERFGFVNAVTSAAALMPAARALAAQILACSPAAIAASKDAVYRGLDEPSLAAAIANQVHAKSYQDYLASPDRTEGARAFAEKRKPNWIL
jgi:enoyl-CoA hydratase/carnithine racemase